MNYSEMSTAVPLILRLESNLPVLSSTLIPQTTTTITTRTAATTLLMECRDIKAFLWQTTFDLTSLPWTMCIFAVIYTLIITLGIIGNSLVILSVSRHRSLQSVRNIFIVSLSCSDVVVSIVSGTITPITAFTKVWLFGAALCKLVPVIQGASLCFSTLTLTAISIDRFILIIYPTKRSIQKRHAFRMILLNCLIATGISMPMFFKQTLINFKDFCGRFCTEDWGNDQSGRSTYGTIVFVLQFVIPFFVITFCYLMISLKLSKGMMLKKTIHQNQISIKGVGANCKRKSNESGSSIAVLTERKKKMSYVVEYSSSPVNAEEQQILRHNSHHSAQVSDHCSEQRRQALKRRLRTNRMLMAMVGVFLCCWAPYVAFNFLRDYQWLPSIVLGQEYLCGIITHCISMSSTVWNPVLYALLNEHFRHAFMELLKRGHRRRENSKLNCTKKDSLVSRLRKTPKLISTTSAVNDQCAFTETFGTSSTGVGITVLSNDNAFGTEMPGKNQQQKSESKQPMISSDNKSITLYDTSLSLEENDDKHNDAAKIAPAEYKRTESNIALVSSNFNSANVYDVGFRDSDEEI